MLDDGSLPDKRQKTTLLLSFVLAGVIGVGTAHAPLYEKTDTLLLAGGTTLMASTMPISPLKYPSYAYLVPTDDYYIIKLVDEIIACESGGRHERVWGDKGKAYGIAQFWEETFYWMAEMANLENPNWKSKEQQITLLGWALENGLGNHWTCYRELLDN
jgi:hypothetical protein